mmetsp:Transcript_77083/g.121737  ORF Transcript_77083/g.121737 Transcript_77083/m.121737 type:complete len:229 (-) Transcript_77083:98-784(-)
MLWFLLTFAWSVSCGASDTVVALNDTTFEDTTRSIQGDIPGGWFVKFYAPWCGHCQSLAPAWEGVANDLKGTTQVAKVDASSKSGKALSLRFSIKGFPTLILFRDGMQYLYSGQRERAPLVKFAMDGWRNETGKPVVSDLVNITQAATWIQDDVQKERTWWRFAVPVASFFAFVIGITIGINCCGPPHDEMAELRRFDRERRIRRSHGDEDADFATRRTIQATKTHGE